MLICLKVSRGVAQPGSAPEWGSGGRRFESDHPDLLPDYSEGITLVEQYLCLRQLVQDLVATTEFYSHLE